MCFVINLLIVVSRIGVVVIMIVVRSLIMLIFIMWFLNGCV